MNYPLVAISDFCQTGSGTTPSRTGDGYYGGDIPWIKSGELREKEILVSEEFVTDKALRETSLKIVPAGAILVAMYGATVGRVGLLGIDATTNQAVCHIVPDKDKADLRYMFHALQHKAEELISRGVGGAQPNISQGVIKETRIPLPPIGEQQRIAAILDQADSLRRLRQRAIDRLNSLGQAIFYEMFEGSDRYRGIPLENVADLRRGPFGGALKKEIFVDSGHKVYEQSHAINKTHSIGSYFIDDFKFKEMSAFAVQENDLIVSCSGTLGRVYRIPSDAPSGVINQALLRIRPNENIVIPEYLEHFLESQRMQVFLNGFSRGTGLQNFPPMSDVREISVPVPPKQEQLDFLGRMQLINRQRAVLDKSTRGLARLFFSLQHRAFLGEI